MSAVSFPTAFAVACLGIALYSAMDVTMKALTLQSGVYDAMLWRSAAGVLFGGAVHARRRPARPSRSALRLHVTRGVLVTGMALLFFWGLARVPMAQAIALCFIAPLLAIGMAAVLLGERIGRRVVVASAVAAAGVAVILVGQAEARANPDAFRGALAVLAAAVAYAYNLILMRRQAAHSDPIEVAFFQNLVTCATLALAAPLLAGWPAPGQLPVIAAGGFLATAAGIAFAWAYAHAPASALAPTEYSGLLWAALFGFLFFGELPPGATMAGALLIVGGCLLAARDSRGPPAEAAL